MQANEPVKPTRTTVAWPILVGALVLQLPLILNPGYFAADEMQWWARADVNHMADLPWLPWHDLGVLQYRPLTFNLWLLLAWLFAGAPFAMHGVFAGIGAINASLFGTALHALGASRRIAIVAACVFVLTPYATYTHGWTATLADLLVVLCALLGVLVMLGASDERKCARRLAPVVGAALVAMALTAKESAVVLPALFAAAAWTWRRAGPPAAAVFVAAACIPVVVYLYWRWPALARAGDTDAAYGWSASNVPRRLSEYLLYPYLPPLFEIGPTLEKSTARLGAAVVLLGSFLLSLASASRRLPLLWLALQVALLAPVLVLGIAYNHYAYLATLAAIGIPALAWPRLPAPSRGLVCIAALVVCLHGAQVMQKLRSVGVAERRFHEELVVVLRAAADAAVRVEAADPVDAWMLERFLDHVPGYRGTSFERVERVGSGSAPTHRMDRGGGLHALPPNDDEAGP